MFVYTNVSKILTGTLSGVSIIELGFSKSIKQQLDLSRYTHSQTAFEAVTSRTENSNLKKVESKYYQG